MVEDGGPEGMAAILANIAREICSPLDDLHASLDRVLQERGETLLPKQQSHAQTMIGLCEELSQLTRETLDPAGPSDDQVG